MEDEEEDEEEEEKEERISVQMVILSYFFIYKIG